MTLDEAVENATCDEVMHRTREVAAWNMEKTLHKALRLDTNIVVHRGLAFTKGGSIYQNMKESAIDTLIKQCH